MRVPADYRRGTPARNPQGSAPRSVAQVFLTIRVTTASDPTLTFQACASIPPWSRRPVLVVFIEPDVEFSWGDGLFAHSTLCGELPLPEPEFSAVEFQPSRASLLNADRVIFLVRLRLPSIAASTASRRTRIRDIAVTKPHDWVARLRRRISPGTLAADAVNADALPPARVVGSHFGLLAARCGWASGAASTALGCRPSAYQTTSRERRQELQGHSKSIHCYT